MAFLSTESLILAFRSWAFAFLVELIDIHVRAKAAHPVQLHHQPHLSQVKRPSGD